MTPGILVAAALLQGCAQSQPQHRQTQVRTSYIGLDSATSDDPVIIEPWNFMGVEGHCLVTPRWEIFTTIQNERLRSYLPSFYEAALVEYTTSLGTLPQPPAPLTSYLFGDRRQWKNKTRMMLPHLASSFESLGRGGFTTDGIAVLYDIDDGQWDHDTLALASHEGWHQYAQTTFEHQLPPWLDEGIATLFEGFRLRRGELEFSVSSNRERRYRLREAIRSDSLIPLETLLGSDPHDVLGESKSTLLTYYAQVWALARFLKDGEDGRYRPALENILLLTAEGDLYRQLLRHVGPEEADADRETLVGRRLIEIFFNENFEEFDASYQEWIAEISRSRWGW
ncbi:MAG: hypothetical protein CMJ36_00170 [Phycisphaerae bacterium]|nr:hypothetical protein [Phycisphaerae bacterium]